MANDDLPRGLVPLNWRPAQYHYYRVSTGEDIFLGQPVCMNADGFIHAASLTGVVQFIGVAVGFAGVLKRGLATVDPFLDVSDLTPPTPTSDTGDRWILVDDIPDDQFVIQGDTGGSALTVAAIGTYCDLLARTAAGNTDSGWAGLELDVSQIVTTTAATVRILGLYDRPNTDGTENSFGNFNKIVVDIAHRQRQGANVSPVV